MFMNPIKNTKLKVGQTRTNHKLHAFGRISSVVKFVYKKDIIHIVSIAYDSVFLN